MLDIVGYILCQHFRVHYLSSAAAVFLFHFFVHNYSVIYILRLQVFYIIVGTATTDISRSHRPSLASTLLNGRYSHRLQYTCVIPNKARDIPVIDLRVVYNKVGASSPRSSINHQM